MEKLSFNGLKLNFRYQLMTKQNADYQPGCHSDSYVMLNFFQNIILSFPNDADMLMHAEGVVTCWLKARSSHRHGSLCYEQNTHQQTQNTRCVRSCRDMHKLTILHKYETHTGTKSEHTQRPRLISSKSDSCRSPKSPFYNHNVFSLGSRR